MTLYELLFLSLFFGSLIGILLTAILWRGAAASKKLYGLAAIWIVYLAILALSDRFQTQKVFETGEDECFDEICFAVIDAPASIVEPGSPNPPAIRRTVVTVRISSRSRGRTQAERGLGARLYDAGKYIRVDDTAQRALDAQHSENAGLTQTLSPGQSATTVLLFQVPSDMRQPALALDHGFTPGYFVIGESPFFHEPPIHRLPQNR